MIIPKSPGRSASNGGGNVVPMAKPSETQLLMALAEMHRQGRFAEPDSTGRSASLKEEDAR